MSAEKRFYVATLRGYRSGGGGGGTRLSDTSSVLDRLWDHREVARFHNDVPAAEARAAQLNAEHAAWVAA